MSGGRNRTVRFYSITRVQPDDTSIVMQPGFWTDVKSKLDALTAAAQFTFIKGNEYRGTSRHCSETASDYFYLGRVRDRIDFPESSTGDDDEEPLILNEDGRLVEPCYMYVADNEENEVAILRSSGGPRPETVDKWLTAMFRSVLGNDVLKLTPVLRRGQMERLNAATNVKKFTVKVDKHQPINSTPVDGQSRITGALDEVYDDLEGQASMSFEWSFGNATPTPSTGRKLLTHIREVLDRMSPSTAQVTVIRPDDNGDEIVDHIDFIKERVAFRVEVGSDTDAAQSPDVVTTALRDAVRLYLGQDADDEQ